MAEQHSTADMLNAAIRKNSAVPVDAYNPANPSPGAARGKPMPGNDPKTFKPIAGVARSKNSGKPLPPVPVSRKKR